MPCHVGAVRGWVCMVCMTCMPMTSTSTWPPTRKQWGWRPSRPSSTLPSRPQMLPTMGHGGHAMPCPSNAWLDVYGGWDLHAHDVDVDPMADPKAVGMETIPTFPDPAIPAPDAPNHGTWRAYHAMSEQCVAGCVWGVGPACPWRRRGDRPESSGDGDRSHLPRPRYQP